MATTQLLTAVAAFRHIRDMLTVDALPMILRSQSYREFRSL